jgi:hypothetical protein
VQLAEWLPGKPLSLHNFRLLRTDSKHDGYAALGIVPLPFSPAPPQLSGEPARQAVCRLAVRCGAEDLKQQAAKCL